MGNSEGLWERARAALAHPRLAPAILIVALSLFNVPYDAREEATA